jgi:Mg2+ and Co2+ transporter CorA
VSDVIVVNDWTKKSKGNAKIYTNPITDFAIVENHYGIFWGDQSFATVEEAKRIIEKEFMTSVSFTEQLRQAQQEARKKIEKEYIVDPEEYVDIKLSEYLNMLDRLKWLDALEDAGVDNWQGIDYAYELLKEKK